MLIIGFGNKARQGKDTAVAAIKQWHDAQNSLRQKHGIKHVTRCEITRFAEGLYKEVSDWLKTEQGQLWLGGSRGFTEGREIPSNISRSHDNGKYSHLLQWWGTEFRRSQNPNYWADKTFENISKDTDFLLISDVRFLNEAEAIKKRGGYLVNVQRYYPDGSLFVTKDRDPKHISETELDDYNWDFYLRIPDGHAALTSEFAITLFEYLRKLHE
ncbi:MAG TPA: hypothetical protein VFA52_04335 [Candidatus Paceibacterota bacterium]|jgi:hypothetical protein|nr:hypothetical protein [Candidatus Paceibacterota bacterium]